MMHEKMIQQRDIEKMRNVFVKVRDLNSIGHDQAAQGSSRFDEFIPLPLLSVIEEWITRRC